MKRKKVAVFGVKGFPGFGGASRSNEAIVNLLKDKYDYTIYSVSSHTDKKGGYNGYTQIVFKSFNGKRLNTLQYYIKSVLHAIFIGNYDIVQINHTSSGFIIPFLSLKYKVVSTAHGIIPKDDDKWKKIDKLIFNFSTNLFFRFSNVTITVSKPHLKIFKKYTKKEILYIPNGVNSDHNFNIKKEGKYVLFSAGRIIALKGAHTLLNALNLINYNEQVIIIGSLEHTLNYKKQLLKLSENRNIKYIDLIKERAVLFNYIYNAEFFVFPSFNEGLSNMLLEVASLRTPLICSDIEENIAVFNNDEVLYFKTGNEQDLADKIKWAKNNPKEMAEKAKLAYKKLQTKFRWEIIANQYDEIYKNI